MPDVPMPRLSDSMEEGTIVRWLKAAGEEVAAGEPLVEIETDKANMAYEADSEGPLEILVAEGETVAVGAAIARIGTGPDDADGPAAASAAGDGAAGTPATDGGDRGGTAGGSPATDDDPQRGGTTAAGSGGPAVASPAQGGGANGARPAAGALRPSGGRLKASPVARRLARERGVDLAAVTGSGPGGRIVKADVEKAGPPPAAVSQQPAGAAEPAAAPSGASRPGATVVEPTRAQAIVAQRMAEIKATVPDFQVTVEVAMDEAVALRERIKALGDGPAPSLNDLVVKACGLALRDHPRVNGTFRDGLFELHENVDVGVAVAGEGSLLVPVVHDADRRSLGSIARETRTLAEQARAGTIEPPALAGGTFTVSNLGMLGVTEFTAIVNRGQAAILAVGAVRDVAVVENGELRPGRVMAMTLSSDHRIVYGADAAAFLADVRALLERPLALAVS